MDGGRYRGGFFPQVHLHRFNTYTFPGSLFANSYFAHHMFYRLEVLRDRILSKYFSRHTYSFNNRADFYLAWKEHGWIKTKKLLKEMNDLLKERNIRFIVVSFPVSEQLYPIKSEKDKEYVFFPQRKLKEICNLFHIQYFDLTKALYKNGGPTLYYDYLHLSSQGNDVVDKELTNYLINVLKE